ncbi:Ig-like domain-containing protein [Vulgatibacter incomptus]|uniref:BNR repeat domain protein n=1 Tax=Vulgatibacter incomptus TaxID=1391653 RepID=A0A0K1P948_9BACT|nr:Ig-like domain-containing protein [Vulgatibacter incomptus]AKU90058.1 BNR repeat domain protein [Vulgatibacter incomptus]
MAPRIATLARLLMMGTHALCWACGTPPPVNPPVEVEPEVAASIRVEPESIRLHPGETAELHATAWSDAGKQVAVERFDWSSSSTATATVSAEGLVEAISPGEVVVSVRADGIEGTSQIVVLPIDDGERVARIEIEPDSLALLVHQGKRLHATVLSEHGTVLEDRKVEWTSDTPEVATVSRDGLVTAKAIGRANVTATSDGVSSSVQIEVTSPPAASIRIEGAPGELFIGEEAQLVARVNDAWGAPIVDPSVTWEAKPPELITLSPTGSVAGRQAGVVTVYARVEALEASVRIRISGHSTSLELTPNPLIVDLGYHDRLRATMRDENGDPMEVGEPAFSSSDPEIAAVLDDGTVVGKKAGTTTISATVGPLETHAQVRVVIPRLAKLFVGGNTAGGLTVDGRAYYWRAPLPTREGQEPQPQTAVPFLDLYRFESLSFSDSHACGITTSGETICTGDNDWGQLGNGTTDLPLDAVSLGFRFISVSAGYGYTCALDPVSRAFCWGFNLRGQLGIKSPEVVLIPTPVETDLLFHQPSTSPTRVGGTTCGIALDERTYCWGRELRDPVEEGPPPSSSALAEVEGGNTFVEISASTGGYVGSLGHACALTREGEGYCWGSNLTGQLGTGSNGTSSVPVPIEGGHVFTRIRTAVSPSSLGFSCGLAEDGRAWCWGSNAFSQLGKEACPRGNDIFLCYEATPILLSGQLRFVDIGLGSEGGCGLDYEGRVYCWGYGAVGRRSQGYPLEVPTQIAGQE